jgi:ATPase subunit of ABC transporter with duplicated ATPase domains
LLKIMAGLDTEIEGEARPQPGIHVGFLSQEPQLDPAKDVRGNVEEAVAPIKRALQRLDQVYAAYADEDADFDALAKEQAELEDLVEATDGHNLDRTLEVAADALRLPPWEADVSRLSGGERRRVALCRLLLSKPDMLLLDEPTNHLDLEMRLALSTALQGFEGAMLIVSHDRYLLRSVCDRFLLVDRGSMRPFDGDLDDYRRWIREQDATSTSPSEPAPAGDMRRQQRQQSAEQRRRLQPLRRRVEALERQMESLSAKRSELEDVLADAELYEAERKQELSRVLQDQAEIADRLEAVEADWLTATEELEAQLREG